MFTRFIALVVWLGLLASSVTAVTPAGPRLTGTAPLAVLLAPAVPLAAPHATAHGVFLAQTIVAELPAGVLTLAAASDGSGDLCVDDEAHVVIANAAGVVAVWEHPFFTTDRHEIACVQPQILTTLPQAGTYTVTLTLTDRFAPTYWATPFYLVAKARATSATAPPLGAAAPPPASAVTPTLMPSPASAATLAPSVAPTVVVAPAAAPGGRTMPTWAWAAGLGSAALLALALLLTRRRPRPVASTQAGLVTLTDRATRETRTVILVAGREQVLRRRPLALVPPGGEGATLAQVRLTPGGLHVRTPDGAERELSHDTELTLVDGAVTVRYRAQSAATQLSRTTVKGRLR